MKLEFKHLAPYLPYGIKVAYNDRQPESDNHLPVYGIKKDGHGNISYLGLSGGIDYSAKDYTPILKPLSDYEKVFNECLSKYWESFNFFCTCVHTGNMEYASMESLLEQHFDIFGLIDAGLAINKNDID